MDKHGVHVKLAQTGAFPVNFEKSRVVPRSERGLGRPGGSEVFFIFDVHVDFVKLVMQVKNGAFDLAAVLADFGVASEAQDFFFVEDEL